MAKTIIVGAGPMGLLTGILLHLKGVKELEIIDPRAGTYLRPGHVNSSIFTKVQSLIRQYLTSDPYSFFMNPSNSLHIKEMERMLYEKATALGIKIRKHTFLRLSKGDEASKGIIVSEEGSGEEIFMPAEHVFDCTGGRRDVCHSYNDLSDGIPFIEHTVYDNVIIPNHLIYNMRVRRTDGPIIDDVWFPEFYSLDDGTVEQMERLRALGWDRAVFPTMYKKTFTTNYSTGFSKYCFYLEAPKALQKEHYDEWFKACLDIYLSGKTIEIHDLKPSQKYGEAKEKVRKQTYQVNPTYLDKYEGIAPSLNLSGVYPVGDAQSTPDSRLAHGISDGEGRVAALIKHCSVDPSTGELINIALENYRKDIDYNVSDHNDSIDTLQKESRIKLEKESLRKLIADYQGFLRDKKATMTHKDIASMSKTIHQFEMLSTYYAFFDIEFPVSISRINAILRGDFVDSLKDMSVKEQVRFISLLKDMLTTLPKSYINERQNIEKLTHHLSLKCYEQTTTEIGTLSAKLQQKDIVSNTPSFFAPMDNQAPTIEPEDLKKLDEISAKQLKLFQLLLLSSHQEDVFINQVALARQIITISILKGTPTPSIIINAKHMFDILKAHPVTHPSLRELEKECFRLLMKEESIGFSAPIAVENDVKPKSIDTRLLTVTPRGMMKA